jgi:hypothetical protein
MSAGGRIIFGICAFDAVMRRKKDNFFDGMHETVQFCPYILMDIGRAARFWLFPCCPSEKRGRYFLKKTQNYQLNQWDASDRILREDFNADNAKIDAALAEAKNRGGYIKLKEFTTIADAAQVDIDVSDIDFSQWQEVHVDTELIATGIMGAILFSGSDTEFCRAVGGSSDSPQKLAYLSGAKAASRSHISFFPGQNQDCQVVCFTMSTTGAYCGINSAMIYRELKKLCVKCYSGTDKLLAGSKVTLWGVR